MTAKKTVEVFTDSNWVQHNPLRDEYSDKLIEGRYRTVGLVTISWDDKKLTSLAKADSDIDDMADGKGERMALRLNVAAAEDIGRSGFSVFSENEYLLEKTDAVPSADQKKIVVPVAAHYLKRLEGEYVLDKVARESFDYAVKRLFDYAASPPPSGYANDSEELYRFIQECFACGYVGYERMWVNEKMGRIRRALDELEARTNRGHEGYKRAQDEITGILISFPSPKSWWREPPVLASRKG